MSVVVRMRVFARAAAAIVISVACAANSLRAQAVVIEAPTATVLTTVMPKMVVRLLGFPKTSAFQVHLTVGQSNLARGLLDSTFITTDTIFPIQITRALPSQGTVFWQVRVGTVTLPEVFSAVVGPKLLPRWLTLISPNDPGGNTFKNTRRPQFVWSSAGVDTNTNRWTYQIIITKNGVAEFSSGSDFTDTTFTPSSELETDVFYQWFVRARLRTGETAEETNRSTFSIIEDGAPRATALYQNFPNPFPTERSQSTCFWFDVAKPGTKIGLDIVDLRGNFVKRIVPSAEGIGTFDAGRFGRGDTGVENNCSNRFVWDGTAANGVPVNPGVYLARFRVNGAVTKYWKILYVGR